MPTNLIAALLFAAQSAPLVVAPPTDTPERADAAYEQLSSGETDAAIASLEARLAADPDHPVLLINLGTAYARAGRMEDAREAYRAAIAARERYSLELADGSWEDSRKTARTALNRLEQSSTFAVK